MKLWGPVIVWAGLIFALSSMPSLNSGLGTWDDVLRKCAHVTEYAILGFLLLRATGREAAGAARSASSTRPLTSSTSTSSHGRHASPVDVLIDSVGLLIGIFVVQRLVLQSRRA